MRNKKLLNKLIIKIRPDLHCPLSDLSYKLFENYLVNTRVNLTFFTFDLKEEKAPRNSKFLLDCDMWSLDNALP